MRTIRRPPPDRRRDAGAHRPRRADVARVACGSTWAWRPASARRIGCSRKRTGARRAAPTSRSVSWRPTAGRGPARSWTGSRSCRACASNTAAWSSRRWTPTPSSSGMPTVALIDELAHTNVPGSPREKRWQDVELILDAGIDVISTCNVQHLESVADAVADHHRSSGQRAPSGRSARGRRRGRAGRHEPPRAPPAHASRQRLPTRASADRARPILHRAEPDRASRALTPLRHVARRRAARGHRPESAARRRCRPSPNASSCRSTSDPSVDAPCVGARRSPAPFMHH